MTSAVFSAERVKRIGLWSGLIMAGVLLVIGEPESLTVSGRALSPAWVTLCLLVVMATWWVTEAIPIPVTALLPMIVLPLTGTRTMAEAAAPYMHPVVVLLMGGFIFAKALERWRLHERIALNIVARSSGSPTQLVGAFMLAAAMLSMWISNTATCLMMVPIAMSVAAAIGDGSEHSRRFQIALLLGVAYGCSIGGLGTPIGTPTNLIVIGYLDSEAGVEISFSQWLTFGIPVVLVLLPAAWWTLTRWAFRLASNDNTSARDTVTRSLQELGPMQSAERRVVTVFIAVAALWIFRRPLSDITLQLNGSDVMPLGGLTDHLIALLAVLLCFLIPAGARKARTLLDWKTAEQIPWGVLLLFGGGMSLASAMNASGLGTFLGNSLAGVDALPTWLLIACITTVILVLTEVTSNIATASALMPVIGSLAIASGISIEMLAAPIALAASCAFMFPMATGPNAVVFAAGEFNMLTMARAGIRLNVLAVVVITFASMTLAPWVLGSA
ncbi:MAG: DASS family sodium-coupled anion symporter [Pseudomonadota bacterium]